MVSSRTADRPHGPCRVLAPLSSTETDEGKGWGGGARGALRVSTTEAPSSPAGAFFSLEEEPSGGLPAPLSEVAGRQVKVVRHVLEDLDSVCPVVQILDLPVPHRMDHLAELLNLEEDVLDAGRLVDRFFQVPELVIEVPKISLDVIPLRTLVLSRSWRNSWWKYRRSSHFPRLQRIMEQTVDIPVPQGGGRHADLQGFFSEDRVQQVPSRSLTFPVEVFKVLELDSVRQRLRLFTLQLV